MPPKREKKYMAVSVQFLKDSKYNTSAKRMKYIRQMGFEPLKRGHQTPSGIIKYRIHTYDSKKKHKTIKKPDNVNIIIEY